MKILAGNSNRPLAEAISAYLGVPLTKASVRRFSDMEVFVEVQENVRGEDVFIIQSTSYPANDNLMELLVCMDALRRSSAHGDSPTAPSSQRSRKVSRRIARAPGLAHCGDEIPVLTSAPSLRAIGCVPLAPRMSRRGAGSNAGLLRFAPCLIYSATRSYAMTSCAR